VLGLGILELMSEARIFPTIFLKTRYPEIVKLVVRNVQELYHVGKQLVPCVHGLIVARNNFSPFQGNWLNLYFLKK